MPVYGLQSRSGMRRFTDFNGRGRHTTAEIASDYLAKEKDPAGPKTGTAPYRPWVGRFLWGRLIGHRAIVEQIAKGHRGKGTTGWEPVAIGNQIRFYVFPRGGWET